MTFKQPFEAEVKFHNDRTVRTNYEGRVMIAEGAIALLDEGFDDHGLIVPLDQVKEIDPEDEL